MKLFHARRFQEARAAFQEARRGPERDVAQRADLHLRMCERRLEQAAVTFATAEEHYNYAIVLINTRRLAEAQPHLEKALEIEPQSDHVLYALGLVQAMQGRYEAGAEYLRRAIELDPRNRIAARQDADLAPYAQQPPIDALLYPEKRGWQS